MPRLAECDPMTGELIRASRATTHRYEKTRPGELVHMDVKKLGKIPDGGGWRAHGQTVINHRSRVNKTRLGYDFVHSLIDDYSRLAYSEILPDEKGTTCAGFLARAAAYFASYGITRIERVMTDNAWALQVVPARGVRRARRPAGVHQAALPLAERQGGAAQPDPAGRVGLPPGLHQQRRTSRRPAPWLELYNTQRRHSALGGLPPISRLEPT